jgi:hypothetical protein
LALQTVVTKNVTTRSLLSSALSCGEHVSRRSAVSVRVVCWGWSANVVMVLSHHAPICHILGKDYRTAKSKLLFDSRT